MSIQKVTQKEAHGRYQFEGLLGQGTSGMVYAATNKSTKQRVAIKTMIIDKSMYNEITKEIHMMFSLKSKYVVSIVEALEFDSHLWIIMENCEGGAISDIMLAIGSPLNEDQAKEVIAYTLLALEHCHKNGIIHRDIKAANILLDESGCAKLADFGLGAEIKGKIKKRTTVIGTAHYMSPEMVQGKAYDGSTDVWSLGITLYELCEGLPPHHRKSSQASQTMIATRSSPKLKDPSRWSDNCKDFLDQCLERNVEKRASVSKLLQHPWVKSVVKKVRSNSKFGDSALTAFYKSNLRAIMAFRHRNDSSDESDNDDDFAKLGEMEALRKEKEREANELEEAKLKAEEELENERQRLADEHAAFEKEAARLKAEKEEQQREAARLAHEQEFLEKEAARLRAEDEEKQREKAQALARQEVTESVEVSTKGDEEEKQVGAANLNATSLEWPPLFEMSALKRNNSSFKLSDWKAAYFVLDKGILKYFRRQSDYHHNCHNASSQKKENRFELTESSTVQLLEPSSKYHAVVVSDMGQKWEVTIRCEDEASCREWMRNILSHTEHLKLKGNEQTISTAENRGQIRAGSVCEDGNDEFDEGSMSERRGPVIVHGVIRKARKSQQQQALLDLKRLSTALSEVDLNSTDHVPCDLRGWVDKRTDRSHHWKKRYCVMSNGIINYFLTDENEEPQGSYLLLKSNTVTLDGDCIIKIENIRFVNDDEKKVISLALRFDADDWVIQTWVRAMEQYIFLSRNDIKTIV